jgi:hypothetical protein
MYKIKDLKYQKKKSVHFVPYQNGGSSNPFHLNLFETGGNKASCQLIQK